MSVIEVKDLSFAYGGGTPVFDGVSFTLDDNWRLGLIGRNGRGKTTLLNILAGKLDYSGSIVARRRFEYFPKEVQDRTAAVGAVIKSIYHCDEDWRILRELNGLKLDPEILDAPFNTLSAGEQTKVMLAGMFVTENCLLIDEPTNHLDALSRKTVADWLAKKRGFILVSHDREFLDRCVDHIMSINRNDITVTGGNCSQWLYEYEKTQESEREQNDKLKKDIARLNESARQTAVWADKSERSKFGKDKKSGLRPDKGFVSAKSARLMKHAKATEARLERAAEQKSQLFKNTETSEELKLSPVAYRAERILECRKLAPKYGGRPVCKPIDFELLRGERVALNGGNGCGKSSLIKLISGENIEYDGSFEIGAGVKISYVPQTADGLKGKLSDLCTDRGTDKSAVMTILRKMGFDRALFDCDVISYSEGQKKKVLLALSLTESAHLYVWDEPLNYLDLFSRIQLQELIKQYCPTLVFVEHDSAFASDVATKTVDMVKV